MGIPAVFLDRDGTINVEKNYLYRIEDWEWIPGAIEAIKLINQMGYLAIVVTNQAGVARGYYSQEDVKLLHEKVNEILHRHGAKIDAFYYCPHHSEFGLIRDCQCRKPKPGMLLNAKEECEIDLDRSYLIGDKVIDMRAALAVGVQPIMVSTGYGQDESKKVPRTTLIELNLSSAVKRIFDINNMGT